MVRKIASKTILIIIIALATFISGNISYQIEKQCPTLPQSAFLRSDLVPITIPCLTRIIAINLFGFLTFFIPLISLYSWIKPRNKKQWPMEKDKEKKQIENY